MDYREDDLCLSFLVEKSGKSLKEVIRLLGINRRTWDNWLWGISVPNGCQRQRLAEILGVSAGTITRIIARNRAGWERAQRQKRVDSCEQGNRIRCCKIEIIEVAVHIAVSVLTSVIVTLKISGKF